MWSFFALSAASSSSSFAAFNRASISSRFAICSDELKNDARLEMLLVPVVVLIRRSRSAFSVAIFSFFAAIAASSSSRCSASVFASRSSRLATCSGVEKKLALFDIVITWRALWPLCFSILRLVGRNGVLVVSLAI